MLPYESSFLFVDEISYISDQKVIGHYSFRKDSFFYNAHFSHIPITPGVLLIEMMGQIGMVCHLIYLNDLHKTKQKFHPILTNVEASFIKPVVVNDKLTIISDKIYYRKGILKSNIQLLNSKNEICSVLCCHLHLVYD